MGILKYDKAERDALGGMMPASNPNPEMARPGLDFFQKRPPQTDKQQGQLAALLKKRNDDMRRDQMAQMRQSGAFK